MKPLRAALNLGEKNENLSPSADVLHNTSNLVISRCCFADDGKEMDRNEKMHVQRTAKILAKIRAARAARLFMLF